MKTSFLENKQTAKVAFLLLVVLQLMLCIWMGHKKQSFFTDEIYSYGLANSEDYTFLNYESAQEYGAERGGWVDSNYFRDYVEVNADTPFSFSAAFRNQTNDVHPPLYYILLHSVCSLFPDHLTKWTGIGLNLVIMLFVDFLLYYVGQMAFGTEKSKIWFAIFLWGLSAAGVSNVLFIRMYLMQTAELLAYISAHIYLFKQEKRFSIKNLALLSIAVILGGLTQYYFYVFAFCFSAPICIALLYKKKFTDFFKYALALMVGFFLNLVIFPATLYHVFKGYRGQEATSNLLGGRGEVISQYLKWINNSLFGGLFLIVALFILAIVVYRYFFSVKIEKKAEQSYTVIFEQREKRKVQWELSLNTLLYLLSSFAIIGFAYVAMIGSNLVSNRYIYGIYPIVALWIVSILSWMIKDKRVILGLTAIMCLLSFVRYGVDFQYPEYPEYKEKAQTLEGDDCLLYYGTEWVDTYMALPLKFLYDESYFFAPEEIENLDEILAKRSTDDDVVVHLPDPTSKEDAESILNQILSATEYNSYELVYQYYTQAYLLKK